VCCNQARIGAPADGAELWGRFQVRVETEHRLTPGDAAELRPWALELLLDGDVGLQHAFPNSSRANTVLTVSPLEAGHHTLDLVLRFPGDDIPGSAVFAPAPRVQHRVRVFSHGDVALPVHPRPRPADTLTARVRVRRAAADGSDEAHEETEVWRAADTALVIVDMWAEHECVAAALRVAALAPRVAAFAAALRDRGALIVHAPSSGVDEMAPGFPEPRARARAGAAACARREECALAGVTHAGSAHPPLPREPPLPFPAGCPSASSPSGPEAGPLHAQHAGVPVFPNDALSDSAEEIAGLLRAERVNQVPPRGGPVHWRSRTRLCRWSR